VSAEPVLERTGGATAVESHASTAALAAEWDALAQRLGAQPFLRPGWIEAWIGAFPSPGFRVLAARRRDGQLTGVLPLISARGRVLASPANSHTPLGGALVDGRDAASALADALLRRRPARADFRYAAPSDPLVAELKSRRPVIERVISQQPYVDTTGSFDDYLAGLDRKHRKEAGRLRRKLAAEGELTFEFAGGTEDLDALLEEGFAIEGSGWKTEQGTAINSYPDAQRFYTDVARWAAGRGWLRLAFLRVDGRALAFDYCLEVGGSFYALKGGYDPEYRRLGPGVVLTHESLARSFADPDLNTYEFLGMADSYKLQWTSATRERLRVQAFSRSPLGLAQYGAWQHGRPLAKRVQARLGRG
jgi:CelD/BcsL family acetyltransferase involved in cellulose biosynthesis